MNKAKNMIETLNEIFQAAPQETQAFMAESFVSSKRRNPSTVFGIFRYLLGESLEMSSRGFSLSDEDGEAALTCVGVCNALNYMVHSKSKSHPTQFDWADSVKRRLYFPGITEIESNISINSEDTTSWLGIMQSAFGGEDVIVAIYDDGDDNYGAIRGFVPMKTEALVTA